MAHSRSEDVGAALLESFEVLLGGGVEVHAAFHSRDYKDRSASGEIDSAKEVVGEAEGQVGNSVGGGGSNDEDGGVVRQPDMARVVAKPAFEEIRCGRGGG